MPVVTGPEGTHPYDASHPLSGDGHLIRPVVEYPHRLGYSITGGYVYPGPSIAGGRRPRRVRGLLQRAAVTLGIGSKAPRDDSSIAKAAGLRTPTSFGQGTDGTLYARSQGGTCTASLRRRHLYESLTRAEWFRDAARGDSSVHAPAAARGVDG